MPSKTARLNQPTRNEAAVTKVPNLLNFDEAKTRIEKLVKCMDEQEQFAMNNRHLRYTEIDIEAERKSNRIAPDELYIPQHLIDTNIRREQAKYVAYISSARRSAILRDLDNPATDCSLLEIDFTNRFRYDGWQTSLYRCVDGMQQNGYGILELVNDTTQPGHLKFQEVAYGDFGYPLDTRDIQSAEMITRRYYFTRTQLLAMADEQTWKFDKEETQKVVVTSPEGEINDFKETSLYKVEKVSFRNKGVVYVGWSCQRSCNDWLRAPRPLYLGRQTLDTTTGQWIKAFETAYPYFIAQYNITENVVIKQLKGRSYLDQDCQEAVSSLVSSYVTAHRRAAGLYFSKDTEGDPNNDTVTQSNDFFKIGCLINARIKQFQLAAPDSSMMTAIQALMGMNMQENSQIDYAANNRKDSRKTATEIQAAQTEAQLLSTIQLALFSTFMKQATTAFFEIVRSRVMARLITDVTSVVKQLYAGRYTVKPSGDTDVIEKQEKIIHMQQLWPIVANTAAAQPFLNRLLTLLFPDDAAIYTQAIQQDTQLKSALASCLHVLQSFLADPSQLSPKAQPELPQLRSLVMQIGSMFSSQQQNGQPKPKQLTQGQQ